MTIPTSNSTNSNYAASGVGIFGTLTVASRWSNTSSPIRARIVRSHPGHTCRFELEAIKDRMDEIPKDQRLHVEVHVTRPPGRRQETILKKAPVHRIEREDLAEVYPIPMTVDLQDCHKVELMVCGVTEHGHLADLARFVWTISNPYVDSPSATSSLSYDDGSLKPHRGGASSIKSARSTSSAFSLFGRLRSRLGGRPGERPGAGAGASTQSLAVSQSQSHGHGSNLGESSLGSEADLNRSPLSVPTTPRVGAYPGAGDSVSSFGHALGNQRQESTAA